MQPEASAAVVGVAVGAGLGDVVARGDVVSPAPQAAISAVKACLAVDSAASAICWPVVTAFCAPVTEVADVVRLDDEPEPVLPVVAVLVVPVLVLFCAASSSASWDCAAATV